LSHPGIFYTHNDSGDEERVYAINSKGDLLSTYRLGEEGRAIDVEDIALSELHGQSFIYVADRGDNRARRKDGIRIDRFIEPPFAPSPGEETSKEPPKEQVIEEFESITLTYPDGAQDAEALLVDPETGAIVIITKVPGAWARVFVRDDFTSGALRMAGEMTPEKTGQAIQYVTAADVSATGEYIGVRTYSYAYLFSRRPGQDLAQALLGRACTVPTGRELQGEALALLTLEKSGIPSFLTISEGESPEIFLSEAFPQAESSSQSK
jgi:hypothetical protein